MYAKKHISSFVLAGAICFTISRTRQLPPPLEFEDTGDPAVCTLEIEA